MTESTVSETPSFGLADLVFTLQVIEACSQRGAFRAEELSQVGALYDRLKTFLVANNALGQPNEGVESSESVQGE